MALEIIEIDTNRGVVCKAVLRSLPQWFGIEKAILQYVRDVENMFTLVAQDEGQVVGFISVNAHNEWTAEIHVMGVLGPYHRKGIGTRLLAKAEAHLRAKQFKFLTVKTLSAAKKNLEYERTREFYFARGFRPLEEMKQYWGADNFCLFMAKPL